MTLFQSTALLVVLVWLAAVAWRYRRSTPVLVGGLVVVGAYAAAAVATGRASLADLGLGLGRSPAWTMGWALGGLAVLLAWSPVADRIATRLVAAPPTLGTFAALKQSAAKLVAGIVVAWSLGGVLEELTFRGVVLPAVARGLGPFLPGGVASAIAVVVAALGAGVIHFYQGERAVLIIVQLSVLFGVLFVVSGGNLWSVMLCHGLYDTIAFIRFGLGKSKYSKTADAGAA
ncbi:MAG TPA: CPBP family intramembrane glutamic endopeptidase [Caulobacteraceae bacterium]|nr:CPBP family intramembrane glutamic endopeptidase [Caulobacteraceae bacterium]